MNPDNFYYSVGDIVEINETSWKVRDVTMKYGIQSTYGLERETKEGEMEYMNIDTGSLETIMGVKKWENRLKNMDTAANL